MGTEQPSSSIENASEDPGNVSAEAACCYAKCSNNAWYGPYPGVDAGNCHNFAVYLCNTKGMQLYDIRWGSCQATRRVGSVGGLIPADAERWGGWLTASERAWEPGRSPHEHAKSRPPCERTGPVRPSCQFWMWMGTLVAVMLPAVSMMRALRV